ncbi:MAG: STAS domain-containing protein [Methylocystis sp.]|uniref:STAS domain-containing protein n=1 Tax=Methylocystis sp. TaxID=1911079 RepID=UPI003DA40D2F
MKLETQSQNGQIVVAVREERLDAHNSGELKDRFLRLLEEGGRHLVVDLSSVNFIDSSGLGALLSGYKNASQRGGSLVLAGPQPRVRAMFELTRLNRVFDIYPRLQEALASQSVG